MKKSLETLQEELNEATKSSWDGKSRIVSDSDKIQADGQTWGVVSDHGNVELCHRGGNGRIYFHGGLV